jgi:hypothetical protein
VIEKYGVEDKHALIEKELAQIKAKLDEMDKTAAAGEAKRLEARKQELEDALHPSDS